MYLNLPLSDYLITNDSSKKSWVYDIEVYPNFFCVTFFNGKITKQFQIGFDINQTEELLSFINNKILIGYNNLNFDDNIINYIHMCKKNLLLNPIDSSTSLIFNIAKKIIVDNEKNNKKHDDFIKELKYYKKNYQSIDLMKIGNFQKSLKLLAVNIKHEKIQDLPYEWDKPITKEQSGKVLAYNYNDSIITYKLLRHLEEEIELRYVISNEYDVYVMNESRSGMANKLLKKFYKEKLGSDINFDILRTSRGDISIKDVISDKVHFSTRKMNKIFSDLQKIILLKNNGYEYSFPKIEYKDKEYQIGVGGIHSNDSANFFRSTDNLLIIDADVSSYYPAIMINEKIKPAHLGNEFFDLINEIRTSRLLYKKSGDKVKSEGLKIVINSIFGKLGFGGFFLYDQLAFYKVTINGQLFLLMLIERLEENGIEVISTNTDGVVIKTSKENEEKYYRICSEWAKELNFELEFNYYSHYIRKDVNNYLALSLNNDIKSKGVFLQNIDLNKGFQYPVIKKALYEYFINGIDYKKYIKEYDDILDFCMSEKVGSQFHTVMYGNDKIQKSLRYYASINGKKIRKIKKDSNGNDSITELCAGRVVTVINDYEFRNDYNIDYDFYFSEIKKIIDEIEVKKSIVRSLF